MYVDIDFLALKYKHDVIFILIPLAFARNNVKTRETNNEFSILAGEGVCARLPASKHSFFRKINKKK